MCLGSISGDFSANKMKKTGLNGCVYDFSVDYKISDTSDIINIHKYKTEPTVIDLHPNEYSQELYYYPFTVKLDQCVKSWNNLNDLPNKVCVPNKTEGLYLKLSNMITGITESKTLKKYISCECKCRFDGRKCNSN